MGGKRPGDGRRRPWQLAGRQPAGLYFWLSQDKSKQIAKISPLLKHHPDCTPFIIQQRSPPELNRSTKRILTVCGMDQAFPRRNLKNDGEMPPAQCRVVKMLFSIHLFPPLYLTLLYSTLLYSTLLYSCNDRLALILQAPDA